MVGGVGVKRHSIKETSRCEALFLFDGNIIIFNRKSYLSRITPETRKMHQKAQQKWREAHHFVMLACLLHFALLGVTVGR